MHSEKEIEIANKTSQDSLAWANKAIVPRIIRELFSPKENLKILDFGAGKIAAHTLSLRKEGYDVTAYEFGKNFVGGLHDKHAFAETYDVVFASNVLNVQSSVEMLIITLSEIVSVLKPRGVLIANYPSSPRKANLTVIEMERNLSLYFYVERIKNNNVIWKLTLKK